MSTVLIDWPNDSPPDRDDWERVIREVSTPAGGTLTVRISKPEGWGWRVEEAWDSPRALGGRPVAGVSPPERIHGDDFRERIHRALKEAGKPVVE